jgi:hypothetical protein
MYSQIQTPSIVTPTCENIYILSGSQPAYKAPDNYHINSELIWGCHQSLAKLAEHKCPADMGAGSQGY